MKASFDSHTGLDNVDQWIGQIKAEIERHRSKIDAVEEPLRYDVVSELNSIMTAFRVSQSVTIQKAWSDGQKVSIHALCFRLSTGKLKHLGVQFDSPTTCAALLEQAISALFQSYYS